MGERSWIFFGMISKACSRKRKEENLVFFFCPGDQRFGDHAKADPQTDLLRHDLQSLQAIVNSRHHCGCWHAEDLFCTLQQ